MPDAQGTGIRISRRECAPGVCELSIHGTIDWSNYRRLDEAFRGIFDDGVYRIVVNLRDTKYISSAGFGCFLSSLDIAHRNNGDLVFAATPREIRDVFQILGLANVIRFAPDEAEAAAELA